MIRRYIVALALTLAAVASMPAQPARSADVQFKAAEYKELVEGDLRGAITEYEKLVAGADRLRAAQSLLRIAAIHQRLGTGQAEAVYDRVIREYGDQPASVAFARSKRPAPPAPPATAAAARAPQTVSFAPAARNTLIVVVDRKGNVLQRVQDTTQIHMVSMSPDGQRLAYSLDSGRVMVVDIATGVRTDVGTGISPAGWSPDGSRLALLDRRGNDTAIITSSAFGPGDEDLLVRSASGITHWTSDGRFVVAGVPPNWALIPVAPGDRTPIPILPQSIGVGPRVSPDSRFLAYTTSDVRGEVIMVRPVNLDKEAASLDVRQWRLSASGAIGGSRWRADGGEFYYITADGYVMAVPIMTSGDEFSSGTPVRLLRAPSALVLDSVVGRRFDTNADGDRFVFVVATGQ